MIEHAAAQPTAEESRVLAEPITEQAQATAEHMNQQRAVLAVPMTSHAQAAAGALKKQAIVDVILPCLNEAQALPHVLAALPRGYRAIVVDNGSTDGSATVAKSLGALVVHEARKGYGAACHRGLESATADLVAFCDADASLSLAALPVLAEPVLAGHADLSMGYRRTALRGSWPLHARLANRFLAWRVRRSTGAPIRDIAPVRVARREALVGLEISDRRSGYPLQMVVLAAQAGWRIQEYPVTYSPRLGTSKVTGTVRGTVTAIKDMSAVLAAGRRSASAEHERSLAEHEPATAERQRTMAEPEHTMAKHERPQS